MNDGYTALFSGDNDGAITAFSHAIALDPKFGMAYGTRAMMYYLKGDYAHAIADNTEGLRDRRWRIMRRGSRSTRKTPASTTSAVAFSCASTIYRWPSPISRRPSSSTRTTRARRPISPTRRRWRTRIEPRA